MTVTVSADGVVLLQGDCPLEDAEVLLRFLSHDPETEVDWSNCENIHSAVVQVLMVGRPRIVGFPTDPIIRRYLGPLN